jgi:hypothetical protein
MIFLEQQKFLLGKIVLTPTALQSLSVEEICRAIDRHCVGDWGLVCEADRAENEFALQHGLRVMSVFESKGGVRFLVMSECDRSVTTVLFLCDL